MDVGFRPDETFWRRSLIKSFTGLCDSDYVTRDVVSEMDIFRGYKAFFQIMFPYFNNKIRKRID